MLSSDLREKAIQYVDAEITLRQFEDWYSERIHDFVRFPHSEDADFLAAIELALSEFDDGYRAEDQVRQYIKDALVEYRTIVIENPAEVTTTSSSNQNIESPAFTLTPVYQL